MTEKLIIPIQKDMWREKNGEIYLLGSVCPDCGEIYFPAKDIPVCAYCSGEDVKEIELKGSGTIYNMVTIDYPPAGGFYKGPVPFTCLIIRMDDDVLVSGHLAGAAAEEVKIGDRVKVIVDILFEDEQETVMSYKFVPVK